MLRPGNSYPGTVVNSNESGAGILPLVLFYLFLCEFQIVFGEYFTLSSVAPDLILVAVIATGVFRGTEQGFWLGMYGGFLQEMSAVSGSDFGYLILIKMFTGFICGKLTHSVRSTFIAVPVLMIAMGTLVQSEILSFVLNGFVMPGVNGILPVLTNAVICGLPVYYIIYLIPGRINS